jgi:hypothetical protein
MTEQLRSATGRRVLVFVLAFFVCLSIFWQAEATKHKTKTPKPKYLNLKGVVTDSHNRPVSGAKVYLIDSSTIDTTTITPMDILSGVAEAYDEPLEDIINNPDKVKTLPQATTDSSGRYAFKKIRSDLFYYGFVMPASSDTEHLPGGDASRIAISPNAIGKSGLQIRLSWNTPSDATYIGTTACYVCHGPGTKADVTSNKRHGHSLMFRKPGQDSANQNAAGHPSSWTDFVNKFTLATDYKTPVPPATSIETLYFQEYDANQSNKFIIYENTPGANIDPTTGKKGDIWVKAYLWYTASGQYNVTLENKINPSDPNNLETFNVALTMGGYLRQRLLLNVPGLQGLYKFISFQAFTGSASQGRMSNYDRTRKPFVEGGPGGGGFSDFFDPKKKLLTPFSSFSTKSNASCAICHIGAGTERQYKNPNTGETLGVTVNDPNGVYDLGGTGSPQEMGINCEQCHGPGSRHRDANLATITAPPPTPTKGKKTPPVTDTTGKYIVNPKLLGNDRSSLICGRCHQEGSPIDGYNNFPPPGISRATYLASYASEKGTPLSRLWPDNRFEKGGHQSLTYSNFLLSKHYRNSRQLLACDDCHDSMGDVAPDGNTYRYFLKGDPNDSTTMSSLCMKCHAIDVSSHVSAKTGSAMMGESMKCIDCHMARTGKGGAGRPGLLLGTPTGVSTDANIVYWENDQSSHIWEVPRKFDPGVAGQLPGGLPTSSPPAIREAMPIPYTNSCGTCHDASKLQFQAPGSSPSAP